MIVLCCVTSAKKGETAAPWIGMAIIFAYFLALLDGLLILRGLLNTVFVKMLFPESRLLPTVASTIDPEFWTFVWVVACWLSWLSLVTSHNANSDIVHFKPIPSHIPRADLTLEQHDTILNMLIAFLLWAIRVSRHDSPHPIVASCHITDGMCLMCVCVCLAVYLSALLAQLFIVCVSNKPHRSLM